MYANIVQAGYTPLHTACHFGQINVVEYLLHQGASTDAVTKVSLLRLNGRKVQAL